MAVRIVTDSGADLSAEVAAEHAITVVPLTVRFGLEEFVDGKGLSNKEFWRRLESGKELPATAAPAADAFSNAFSALAPDDVLCISLSGRLSATYQAAKNAADAAGGRVAVIDSLNCTIAQGNLCIEAARMAAAGADLADLEAAIENLRDRTQLFGVLDTLENLRKGGRIGAANAFFGSLLSIKPVITIREGEVQPESRQRTRKKSLGHLAGLVQQAGPIDNVAVAHAGAPDVEDFLALLGGFTDRQNIRMSDIGPVIGTHGGPRLIAVSFAVGSVR